MLTLVETKVVFKDGVAIGEKELCGIYEVINRKKSKRIRKKSILEN